MYVPEGDTDPVTDCVAVPVIDDVNVCVLLDVALLLADTLAVAVLVSDDDDDGDPEGVLDTLGVSVNDGDCVEDADVVTELV